MKPYELLISFCEAEVVSPKDKRVNAVDNDEYYTIRFTNIDAYFELEKLSGLAALNERHKLKRGEPYETYERYEDRAVWEDLASMLGLISPWIPCSERLPEKEVDILVYTIGGSQYVAEIQFIDDTGRIWWFNGDVYLHAVTHWQPLPPAPEVA